MPTSKRHTIKGTTRKVAPKPHSPPAAPDVVAKKGRKPPRICEDIPWSPLKVVRQKLAPLPDTTIDLTHSNETSPLSSSNQASAAASTLLSLVTVPCSVTAAASTNLYRQLYSAEDNSHKEEQLFSAADDNDEDDNDEDDNDDNDDDDDDDDDDDNDDNDDDDDIEDYIGIHTPADNTDDNNGNDNDEEDYVSIRKHIDDDYKDILDMDIDSEEAFRSSFPKNQISSKLRVKGGDQRPDVSDLFEKEAEEVLD